MLQTIKVMDTLCTNALNDFIPPSRSWRGCVGGQRPCPCRPRCGRRGHPRPLSVEKRLAHSGVRAQRGDERREDRDDDLRDALEGFLSRVFHCVLKLNGVFKDLKSSINQTINLFLLNHGFYRLYGFLRTCTEPVERTRSYG